MTTTVDKFGLMGDEPVIKPYHNYDLNLDDLENVEGFNEEGDKNATYGFQLNKYGIYTRKIIESSGFNLDNYTYQNIPLNLIWENNSWKVIPTDDYWNIYIKVDKNVRTKGENHIVHKIFNSGKIMGSLVPNKNYKNLLKIGQDLSRKHFLYTESKRVILSFKTEFKEDRNLLSNLPDGSQIIIEGMFKPDTENFKELINGLKIKWNGKENAFKIIILKASDNVQIMSSPTGLEDEVDQDELNLKDLFIWKNYVINSIKFKP